MMEEGKTQLFKSVSVIDGMRVQEVLVGRYLNVVTVDCTEFVSLLFKEDYRIRHNFMMLIGQWFLQLSSYDPAAFDERLEGSIKLAQELKPELLKEPLWPWFVFEDQMPDEVVADFHDTESVERLFAAYLSKMEWGNSNLFYWFLYAMYMEDPTLKQSFTRLVLQWCDWVVKKETDTKGAAYRIANLIVSAPSVLLFI